MSQRWISVPAIARPAKAAECSAPCLAAAAMCPIPTTDEPAADIVPAIARPAKAAERSAPCLAAAAKRLGFRMVGGRRRMVGGIGLLILNLVVMSLSPRRLRAIRMTATRTADQRALLQACRRQSGV